jgi:hypothetical protein
MECSIMTGRKSDVWEYENWPRWVRIAYCCTFPVSAPLLMFSMMLGTIAAGLILMTMCVAMLPFSFASRDGGGKS